MDHENHIPFPPARDREADKETHNRHDNAGKHQVESDLAQPAL
jgi:hypothetical protein